VAKRQAREREQFEGFFTDAWVRKARGFAKGVQYLEHRRHGLSLMLYVAPAPVAPTDKVTKTWRAVFYDDNGKMHAKKLGRYPALSLADARTAAEKVDPRREIASKEAGLFGGGDGVAERWYQERVVERELTSRKEIRRHLDTYILPALGDMKLFDIRRSHVIALLKDIKKGKGRRKRAVKKPRKTVQGAEQPKVKRPSWDGAPQADAVLATIRTILMWAMKEIDDYTSPIPPRLDMKLDPRNTEEKARERTLDKAEIRAMWSACDDLGVFGDLVKMLLLTGQRKGLVKTMKRADIVEAVDIELRRDGRSSHVTFENVWIVPEKRSADKGTIGAVSLPAMAAEIVARQPVIEDNPYVFPAARGRSYINSFSKGKRDLDTKMRETAPNMKPWTLHDLRRTARSLLAEEGVADHLAERTLGHKIKGVERVYNRYPYLQEKTDTLRVLAGAVAAILSPANVVPLRPRSA
jgi:integrase